MADYVNQPPHYTKGGLETIDAIKAMMTPDEFQAFCFGNAIKYVWRAKFKGNLEQDIQKAIWYLRIAIGDDPRGK